MLHCSLISMSPFPLQPGVSFTAGAKSGPGSRRLRTFSHIHPGLQVQCSTLQLWCVFSLSVSPLPKSPFLIQYFHPHSSDLGSHSAVLYLHRSLPGTCQFDPCVVLRQRLAEAAEMGNIYRAVRWGWVLLPLHSHPSRQSLLQHLQLQSCFTQMQPL